jgi:putative drug exporter of the RND superfamily
MLAALARTCYRRRRSVVAAWIALLVAVAVSAAAFGGEHHADYTIPGSESAAASDLLAERFPELAGGEIQIVIRADAELATAVAAARTDELLERVSIRDHVAAVERSAVSGDGRTSILTVRFDRRAEQLPVSAIETIMDDVAAARGDGLEAEAGGYPVLLAEAGEAGSEGIGMVAALLILLLAFGSIVAAGLPLAIAVPGLGVGLGLVPILSNVLEVPEWATPIATMIGIGVGIDYALFIVTRYRTELATGAEPEAAVVTALTTSGRAVLFAGGTVVISILGLGTMGLDYMWGFAAATVASVAGVLAAAMTLLPAVLGFVGRSIDRFRLPFVGRRADRPGLWSRWSRVVQRRPLLLGSLALLLLVALAAPATGLRFGYPDGGSSPDGTTSRRAYDLVTESFGPGANGPLVITADLAAVGPASLGRVLDAVVSAPGVAGVVPPLVNEAGDAAAVMVIPATGPQDERTATLIEQLRDDVVPGAAGADAHRFSVGGTTATFVDESAYMADRIPLFIGTVIALSFLLLMAVFRSVLVALKAAVMNLLAIGAAYGVISLAVGGGWLGEAIGIHGATPVPVWVPIMMFAILFGLSMDYEVFLLSRIREEYLRTGDNAASVAHGIATTGRVITAAAAIMVTVFGAFILNDDVISKVAGLGLATAVLIDATVVRMVLVPATMELLGDRNWWMPRWLDRLLPAIDVEGGQAVPSTSPSPRPAPGATPEPAPVRVPVGAGH